MDSQYDVFISYSNADLEFVKRLEGELDYHVNNKVQGKNHYRQKVILYEQPS